MNISSDATLGIAGQAAAALPVCTVDLYALPPERGIALWRDSFGVGYELLVAEDEAHRFGLRTVVRQVGDLLVSEFRAGPAAVRRDPRHLAEAPARMLKIRLYLRGSGELESEGRTFRLGSGAVHVIDQSRRKVERSPDHAQITVCVPHAAVGWDSDRRPAALSLRCDRPLGRMLGGALRDLAVSARTARPAEGRALAAGFVGLLRAILDGAPVGRSRDVRRPVTAEAMRAHLRRHLHEPDCGLATLQRSFGASRATIHRRFEDVGGVAAHVRALRLDGARRELEDGPGGRGAVVAAAERWGFASTSHFSAAFLAAYGLRPSEIVGGRRREAAAAPPGPDGDAVAAEIERLRGFYRAVWSA